MTANMIWSMPDLRPASEFIPRLNQSENFMKIDRSIIKMGNMLEDEDDGFISGTIRERVEMVWEITVSLWAVSTKGNIHAESGLQRDVAVFRRGTG